MIAKLHDYGFNKNSTEYSKDYLSHQKQKIKINKTFSSWANILHGVRQGSILGPLIFSVFLCDLFLFIPNIDLVGYADDNTPFTMGSSELEILHEIKTVVESLTLWFLNNCMKVSPDKFHLLLSDKRIHQMDICNEKLSSTCSEKLLGTKIDSKPTFEEHVEGLCKKASQKISALGRISSLMRFERRKRTVYSFIPSHFPFCPLVWMFHSRRLNNCINYIHEKVFRIIHQDPNFSFK